MKIGIYLGYRPNTQFNNQGLGRFLANLTRGMEQQQVEQITILCPSWLRSDIEKHLRGNGSTAIRVLAPKSVPPIVLVYERLSKGKNEQQPSRRAFLMLGLRRLWLRASDTVLASISYALSTRWWPIFPIVAILLAAIVVVLSPLLILMALLVLLAALPSAVRSRIRVPGLIRKPLGKLKRLLPDALARFEGRRRPPLRWAIYDYIQKSEIRAMLSLARRDNGVDIWYVPTVFWPEASSLKPVVVQCFPDMLLSEFPTKFTLDVGNPLPVYRRAKEAIEGGEYFVTYSRATAEKSLVRRFNIDPSKVFAVPHAAMDLSRHLAIQGTLDDVYARQRLATTILEEHRNAKWNNDRYLSNFSFEDTTYIFFASQFRPNKNLMNLAFAYEAVLRKKHRYAKMILTGSPKDAPEFENYVTKNRLQYDILFAHDVSDRVLAALYHKATLVVNPTYFEGGFPFTFSEGMSVGTPSVMSRIPQTEEIITGELAKTMLFDPLSADDMANRIAFGLDNRSLLLQLQSPLFETLKQRTWQHVARDHINVFEKVLEKNRTN